MKTKVTVIQMFTTEESTVLWGKKSSKITSKYRKYFLNYFNHHGGKKSYSNLALCAELFSNSCASQSLLRNSVQLFSATLRGFLTIACFRSYYIF